MTTTSIRAVLFLAAASLVASQSPALADVLFSSDGSDSGIYVNSWVDYSGTVFGTGTGCTSESSNPFMVNGVSQGSYIAATSYPLAFLSTPAIASAQGIWVGFLMRPIAPDTWAGGISLFSDTFLPADPRTMQFAGLAGWWGNSMNLTLAGPDGGMASGGYSIADGQDVAVLAHLYDTGNSGTFNTGDLYIDANLTDGISFGTPLISDFTLGDAVSTIASVRLGADPVNPEIRDYDNIVVSTTEQEAIDGLNGVAPVPEPTTLALAGLGGLSLLRFRRRKS